MNTDPYQTLGVKPDIAAPDLKMVYRQLIKKHHPDMGGKVENFRRIQEAYDFLSDPVKRRKLDAFQQAFGNVQPVGKTPIKYTYTATAYNPPWPVVTRVEQAFADAFGYLHHVINFVTSGTKYNHKTRKNEEYVVFAHFGKQFRAVWINSGSNVYGGPGAKNGWRIELGRRKKEIWGTGHWSVQYNPGDLLQACVELEFLKAPELKWLSWVAAGLAIPWLIWLGVRLFT